jgi:hypothetical protein
MTGPIINWVSGELCYPVPLLCIRHFATDFSQRCLSKTTLHSPPLTLLLREWAKSKLTGGSWSDALVAALNVSTSSVLVPHVSLTLHCSEVYSPEIHDLLRSMRSSRNGQSHNGCNRVFPPNEQRIGGRDKHAWRAGEMGNRLVLQLARMQHLCD